MMSLKSMLPQGRNAWILLAGVVMIVLLGGVIVMGPIRSRFVELDEAIMIQKKLLGDNLAIVAPAPSEAVEKDFLRFGDTIKWRGNSEKENSMMLSEVDQLAGQSKVVLLSTKPQETRKDRDSESYRVEIEIEANISSLMSFLYAVESSPQLLRIERLVLDSKGGRAPSSHRGTMVISKVVTF